MRRDVDKFDWTDSAIEQLRDLWDDNSLSGLQIGRRMGISKNAVVGKAHRLGLPMRPSPIKRDGVPRPPAPVRGGVRTTLAALAVEAPPPAPPAAPRPRIAPREAEPMRTVFRPRLPSACCWPLWDNRKRPTHKYCGADATPGQPYCAKHRALSLLARPVAQQRKCEAA